MSDRRPLVVLVNGLPGSGKSTLAAPLAAELGLPLYGKDLIKEATADVLGVDALDGRPRRAWSAMLGASASETVWTLLAYAYSGAVVESNLGNAPDLATAGLRRAGVHRPVEIWCDVPIELARKRYRQRAPSRHPIHRNGPGDPETEPDWWHAQNRPLELGPVLRVDTTAAVDIPRIASWCRAQAGG